MVTTHTASWQGLAAPTWLRAREPSHRLGNPTSHALSRPKQTRRSRCIDTAAALTASQETVYVLPCSNDYPMATAGLCIPHPQHAADAATIKLVNALSQPPPATEQQPDVLEVLTQQLADQHIPFCFPSQPLTPAPLSELSAGHLTQAASSYLLDRYLLDVPACTTPPALPTQELQQQVLPQGMHHLPTMPDRHSADTQPLAPRHQQHLKSRQLQHAELASCEPACAVASTGSQHQIQPEAQWTPTELCHSPHFACMQELASRTLLESHRCLDSTCQSVEVLRLQSSKGQTWKGLALRQAFMGQALGHSDDEASVQDAAGGGGLLHGGAEDGGEGGGPSRGWGGAAGEDGDAEEDEDEDEEDEDEDQDDDEDQDYSSSEDSQSESDWTSSAQSGPHSMQRVGDLSHAHGVASSVDDIRHVCSCSQWLHQFPQSKQQTETIYHSDQQDHGFHITSPVFSCAFDSCTNSGYAAANKADANACQQQVLASSIRYRTICRHDVYPIVPSDRKQQDHELRQTDLHIKQKRSGGSVWKDIPDFAIRLCINVLGSCL